MATEMHTIFQDGTRQFDTRIRLSCLVIHPYDLIVLDKPTKHKIQLLRESLGLDSLLLCEERLKSWQGFFFRNTFVETTLSP